MKGVKFKTVFSKEVKVEKIFTGTPNINEVKSKKMRDNIARKRSEKSLTFSKEDWDAFHQDQDNKVNKHLEELAPGQPKLNDNYNKKSELCKERGTGIEWLNKNTRTVDEWKEVYQELESEIAKNIKKECPHQPDNK